MFKELFALTERAPVLVLVTREGDEKLRVNITRKADEDEKDVPLSISILATPAELDTELPLALAEGFALAEADKKPVSVADQVKTQVDAAKADSGTTPAKKSARTKLVKPKVQKMRDPKPAKKATPKPAAPKAAKAKPAVAKPRAAKKARGAGAPLQVPSAALAAVIGAEAVAYNDAVKKVWAYIKANGLQDKKNKRKITVDAKLETLAAGGKLAVENIGKIVKANLGAEGNTGESAPSSPVPNTKPLLPDEPADRGGIAVGPVTEVEPPGGKDPAAPVADLVVKDVTATTITVAPAEQKPAATAGTDDLDLF
jgi:PRTRC genetic system protein E